MSLYHYRVGRGAELVLLHGWGMNAAVWEPLLPQLSADFAVSVIELPGHGESLKAIAADLAEWARSCLAVAPARAHWIGWSLGGQVALRAALDAPARVGGLSLIAATPRFVRAADWSSAMPYESFHAFAEALGEDANATVLRFLSLQVKGAEHASETLRMLRDELAQRPAASRDGLAQGLELLLHTDLRNELANLGCPSHWLFGARDTLVPRGVGGRIAELLPAARISEIDGAGHAPFLSHPQACLALLRDGLGAG
jgi:pimeloyl-[acyl-carrier protein] methyl ester esterase